MSQNLINCLWNYNLFIFLIVITFHGHRFNDKKLNVCPYNFHINLRNQFLDVSYFLAWIYFSKEPDNDMKEHSIF